MSNYDASSMQALRGLDPVRKRPGMYIGSTDGRGLSHLLWEVLDNSIDEAAAGHCDQITITLGQDGSICVADNGRGIPVDKEQTTGTSALVLVFTELHFGGKFGGGAYAAAGGLHGVGASVVNALSSRLEAQVTRDGGRWRAEFSYGELGVWTKGTFTPATDIVKVGKAPKDEHGTQVRWWPDMNIFDQDAELDLVQLRSRCAQLCFLVSGLTITIVDEKAGETETFTSSDGLAGFARTLTDKDLVGEILEFQGRIPYEEQVPVVGDDGNLVMTTMSRECAVDVALAWTTGFDTVTRSFVNTITTPKGGSHVTGFERALVRVMNEALRESSILKVKEDNVIKDDILEGAVAVVRVTMPEPQFEGQTKEILGSQVATGAVNTVVSEQLRAWFAKNAKKPAGRAIMTKVHGAAKARLAARMQRETVRRKNALESASMPAKLADCRSRDREATELLLIEGDSAAGTVKGGRNSEFQALLPLRGKILNAAKASTKDVLDNEECAAIITVLGGGSGRNFDLEALRYGRVIILCDADVDGSHIRVLLLTLFFHYMRPLIEAGRVYAAMPPLYMLKVSGGREHYYAYTDEERDAIRDRIEAEGKKIKDTQRYKGLGEMDADQLAVTTLDPASRTLRRINLSDAEAAAKMFTVLMGTAVEPRREFIYANAAEMNRDNLDV